jgi:hypothetical protein
MNGLGYTAWSESEFEEGGLYIYIYIYMSGNFGLLTTRAEVNEVSGDFWTFCWI